MQCSMCACIWAVSAYEACVALQAAFGPFYRIEQLIISTQPGEGDDEADPILTDANIKLLFSIQAEVDAMRASMPVRLPT